MHLQVARGERLDQVARSAVLVDVDIRATPRMAGVCLGVSWGAKDRTAQNVSYVMVCVGRCVENVGRINS